jgi:SAM-dependent methyltransferase
MTTTTGNLLRLALLPTAAIWDPPYRWWVKRRTGFNGPLPPLHLRRSISGTGADAFWFVRCGSEDAGVYRRAIEQHAYGPLNRLNVLDFGAGIGRLVFYFDGLFQSLQATDVNARAIDYTRHAFPRVRCEVNAPDPPLPYPEQYFDLIYSFSVWTHLPELDQIAWLAEMQRILKPDGLAFVSVHTPAGLDAEMQCNREWIETGKPQIEAKGYFFAAYSQDGLARAPKDMLAQTTPRYGYAVQTPEYIHGVWSRYLEVVELQELAFRHHQSLVVLRKRK